MYKLTYEWNDNYSEVVVSSIEDAMAVKDKLKDITDYCTVREVVADKVESLLWTITREEDGCYSIRFSGLMTIARDKPIVSINHAGLWFALVANDSRDAALVIGTRLIKDAI